MTFLGTEQAERIATFSAIISHVPTPLGNSHTKFLITVRKKTQCFNKSFCRKVWQQVVLPVSRDKTLHAIIRYPFSMHE